ncbi:MAG: ABC transporter permease subunit [Bacilli bacterium]|nr:ABC transporter permease subunit [Bacilli bacterium]
MKRQAKAFIGNNYFIYTLGFIFVFVLWFILSYTIGKGNYYFPSPIEVFKKMGEMLSSSYIYESIGWTILRVLIGFGVALIASFILGLIAGQYKKVYLFLKPIMLVAKSIPTAALVFLFLVLSGSRWAPTYIVFLVSFPILYEAIAGGMHNIPTEVEDSVKLDSNNFFITVLKIKLPLALPYLIIGLTSSFALSLKTEIMAEIVTGDTSRGLGCAISSYRIIDPSDLTPIFAIALIALILVLIVDLIGMIVKKYINIENK